MVDEAAGETEHLRHGAGADEEPVARVRSLPGERAGRAVEMRGDVDHLVRLHEAVLHRNRQRCDVPVVLRGAVLVARRLLRALLREGHADRTVRAGRGARRRQHQVLLREFRWTVVVPASARSQHDPHAQPQPVRLVQGPAEPVGARAVHLSLERGFPVRLRRRYRRAIADDHEFGYADLRELLQVICDHLAWRIHAELEHPHRRMVLLRRRHETVKQRDRLARKRQCYTQRANKRNGTSSHG